MRYIHTPPTLFRVKATAQQCDWGQPGASSVVANLTQNATGQELVKHENKPYGEVKLRLSDPRCNN